MASLPQMSATLGPCNTSKIKIIDARPCIAQLNNNKKSTGLRNLVGKHQIGKGTLFPLASLGQKRPKIELWKHQSEKWKVWAGESSEFPAHALMESVVKDFYRAFNDKNIEELKELISEDCEYQDYLFYSPCKGQEDVIKFWQTVMEALGPNIKIALKDIIVEDVNEDKLMATVFWHLEWGTDKKKLPFSKGCRFFWFKEEEGRLVISKITGIAELPLKPGELVLNMLKAIRTFLDTYPPMAAVLLNNPAFRDE